MDITDQEGDAAAGVVTLPVAAGPSATLAVCQALMAAAAMVGLRVSATGTGLCWLAAAGAPGLVPAARALGSGVVVAAVGTAMAAAERARHAGFSRDTLSAAVEVSMRCTIVGMAAIAVLV